MELFEDLGALGLELLLLGEDFLRKAFVDLLFGGGELALLVLADGVLDLDEFRVRDPAATPGAALDGRQHSHSSSVL